MRILEHQPEMQLQKEIIEYCTKALEQGVEKRRSIKTLEEWEEHRHRLLSIFREAFPTILFKRDYPLNARMVSAYEFEDYRIENIIFESMPGWEVNGTVYLPKQKGIYPGIICPTGHSSKSMESYQTSAQIFARNGYIAISFDPPGCSGELQYMNDHFTNGLIGYLTGIWSQTHFVIDGLRALDYLETREDIDKDKGFVATGVSGGGLTAIFCSILDERIKFTAPVCCLAEHKDIHLRDLYTSCPEQFGPSYIAAGMDYIDYITLIAPRPCLIVAGKHDEVFDFRSTMSLYKEAKSAYKLWGIEDNLELFIDEDSGHAYTARMANEVVARMNRIIKGADFPPLPIGEKDIYIAEKKKLRCYPSNTVNMFTINRDKKRQLSAERSFSQDIVEKEKELHDRILAALGLESPNIYPKMEWEEENPPLRWSHFIQKVNIQLEDEVHIPGLCMGRANNSRKRPALLFLDDRGKWVGFRQGGMLTQVGRFLQREDAENEPLILSIDMSGVGELSPQPTAYDLAPWNDIERILTYLSIAVNRPVMGLRVRDALAALNYLSSRNDVDPNSIMIGGRGIGAIVAIHAGFLWRRTTKIICMNMLSHYGAMAESFPFSWGQSIIIPNLLKAYDLPDIVHVLGDQGVYILNPMDAGMNLISKEQGDLLYCQGMKYGAKIMYELEERNCQQLLVDIVLNGKS